MRFTCGALALLLAYYAGEKIPRSVANAAMQVSN